LNKVIDGCFYPLPETKNTNLRDRPIGLGVQGLANTYMALGFPFESKEARLLNIQIFECIYYKALQVSCELAKKDGYYVTYPGSPASKGLLQFDLWKEVHPEIQLENYLTLGLDWQSLKRDISKYGLRNSLLTTCMPTASTAQIFSNSECIEPITSNMFVRRVLAGEFIVLNKYMVEDFKKLGLWNENTKDLLLHFNGSVQDIPMVPEDLKKKYKTVWEISQKELIQQSADRGLFIDQSQSLNLFLESPSFAKLNSMHFYSWEKGLKTGIYYLRTKSPSRSFQITVNSEKIKELLEPKSCPYVPGQAPEDCLMCSS
jgi:ribonucleotide reductase alpha subunit